MRVSSLVVLAGVSIVGAVSNAANAAVFASGYVANQTSGLVAGYDNPSAAVGGPTLIVAAGTAFQGVMSPFDPPYEASSLVSIGGGGQLTLQFPNWVNVGGGNEVGIFSNVFLADSSYPSGQNYNPVKISGSNSSSGGSASIYVSANGTTWFPISNSPTTVDRPANAYLDATDPYQTNAGTKVADFGIPFTSPDSAFNGLNAAQTLALFGNSGGGTWIDLAGSGLTQIDYIQFRVPQGATLDVDAVSINNNAVGAAVPEPASLAAFAFGTIGLLTRRRR